MRFSVAITGDYDVSLPQWGRCFWQDPNDGELFLAFASGTSETYYVTSADSGNSWTTPSPLFPVDDFSVHNNFDIFMDRRGHVHCGFRYNDSGCYQFVGKTGGGGWTLSSGIGPVGFNVAGDSGIVKGFDGSLVVQETPNSFASEGSIKFPAVKIAAKASGDTVLPYVLGDPYTGVPAQDAISSFDNGSFAGQEGGFPVIHTTTSALGADDTSEFFVYNPVYDGIRGFSKQFGGTYTDTYFGATGSGNVTYAPNMAFGSGLGVQGSDGVHLVCTASGQAFYMGASLGYQRVTTDYSTDLSSPPDTNVNTEGTDVASWRKVPALEGIPSGQGLNLPMAETGVCPTGGIYGVGPNTFVPSGVPVFPFPGGGTNCDFHINDNEEIIFYFQTKNPQGKQAIARVRSEHDFGTPKWLWPKNGHPESGVRYIAPISRDFAGGFSNMLFWENFKSLRHPTEPGDSVTKQEFIVTQSHTSTYPSGGILTVWNVAEAVDVQFGFARPTYSINYVATSGSSRELFEGITKLENFTDSSHVPIAGEMFDDDVSTFGRIKDGYIIEVSLDEPREIDKLEFLNRTLTRPPTIAISGSMDGVNWSRVFTIPSGRLSLGYNDGSPLVRAATRPDTIIDRRNNWRNDQPFFEMDPFVAKFIRFDFKSEFGTGFSTRLYDISIWGPGATEPEIIRYVQDDTTDPFDFRSVNFRKNQARRIETFTKYQQGDLPSDFRTYGDFEWRVVASGQNATTRSSPNAPPAPGSDGIIPFDSGIWGFYGHSRGFKDGFSVRSEAIGDASGLGSPVGHVPAGGIQPGHSGVLEVDVFLSNEDNDETDSTDIRNISFRIRTDTQKDDRVEFWIISPTASDSDVRIERHLDTWEEANNWDSDEFKEGFPNYSEYTYPLQTENAVWGKHTLRWVYYKGEYDSASEQANSPNFGCAWIDMVSGLDASPSNYVKGYMRGDIGFESGAIDGFMVGKGGQNVHGYMFGDPLEETIHGYIFSAVDPDVTSQIHGYIFPANESLIHGYMLGGTGILTIPTGSIHGYISVPDSGGDSTIYGYVEGDWGQIIHGYMQGNQVFGGSGAPGVEATGDQRIYGYLYAIDGASQIHGVMNAGQVFTTMSTHGYIDAKFGLGDQIIHGYMLAPSGAIADIKGMTLGWEQGPSFFRDPQTMIYGYVKTPIADISGQVHGYMIAQYPFESIYGYMGNEALVASGGGSVGGGPGGGGSSTSNVVPGTNWVHGYIKATGLDQVIHGYLLGPPGAFAQRKGYVLAGATDDRIHGYMESVDIASGIIYGYASGIGYGDESIHGYMFGSSGLFSSSIHGYMVGVMLPMSQIHGHMIGTQPSSIVNSEGACLSHTFPLVSVPTVTIPSSCFFC